MSPKFLLLLLTLTYLPPPLLATRLHLNPDQTIATLHLSHDVTATILTDGPLLTVGNPFDNIPDEAVLRSYRLNGQPTDPITIQQNVVVLDTPHGRFMVDTGSFTTPEFPQAVNAGQLFRNLQRAGISTESIDGVLLTHGHVDHIGGLVNGSFHANFPRARLYVMEQEHQFWNADPVPAFGNLSRLFLDLSGAIYKRSVRPYLNRLTLVRPNEQPIPGITFLPTPGHSPFHAAIQLTSPTHQLLLVGDAWVTKADQLQNPEWAFRFSADPLQAYRSRLRLLENAGRKQLVAVFHEAFPGVGYVRQAGPFFLWRALRAWPRAGW